MKNITHNLTNSYSPFVQLFLLLFISVFSLTQVNGQCTVYGNTFYTSGFHCDFTRGNICLSINGALTDNYEDCKSYIVEIEFKTGGFLPAFPIPTGFYEHFFDFDKTIFRGQITLPEDTENNICFKGTLFFQDTEFIYRFLHPDTEDVVESGTFSKPQFTPVTNGGGSKTLSQAIAEDLILPPSLSLDQLQYIYVDGSLLVDMDYSFHNSQIQMAPGASIIIEDGNELKLNATLINGCEDKWEKILVEANASLTLAECLIENGNTAIELKDKSTLKIWKTSFGKNNISIGAFGSELKDINFIAQSNGFIPLTFRGGTYGIYFENVNNNYPLQFLNFDDQTEAGFYSKNSDINISDSKFRNCKNGLVWDGQQNIFSAFNNSFIENDRSLFVDGGLSKTYEFNTFFDNDKGILQYPHPRNIIENTYLSDNTISETFNRAFTGVFQNSVGEFHENQFSNNELSMKFNGVMGRQDLLIHDNTQLGAILNDLHLVNTNSVQVLENGVTSNGNGFVIDGGYLNNIGHNAISSHKEALKVIAAPTSDIHCNYFHGLASAVNLILFNDNSGTVIRGNEMIGSSYNLAYGSTRNNYAHVGFQSYRNNVFDESSENNAKAKNFNESFITELNRFILSPGGANQGNTSFPFFEAQDEEWFVIGEENKDDSGCDASPPADQVKLSMTIEAAKNLLEAFPDTTAERRIFEAEYNLAFSLTFYENNFGVYNEDYWDLISDPAVVSLAEISYEMHYNSGLTDEELDIFTGINNDYITAVKELNSLLVSESENFDDDYRDISELPGYLSLSETLTEEKTALISFISPLNERYLDKVTGLHELVKTLEPISQAGQYYREALEIYLRLVERGTELNSIEFSTVEFLASMCSHEFPRSVFLARSLTLWSIPLQKEREYPDNCDDNIVSNREAIAALDYEIFPVPTANIVNVRLGNIQSECTMFLKNSLGQVLQTIRFSGSEVEVDMSAYSGGMYFLEDAEGKYRTKKIIKVR